MSRAAPHEQLVVSVSDPVSVVLSESRPIIWHAFMALMSRKVGTLSLTISDWTRGREERTNKPTKSCRAD